MLVRAFITTNEQCLQKRGRMGQVKQGQARSSEVNGMFCCSWSPCTELAMLARAFVTTKQQCLQKEGMGQVKQGNEWFGVWPMTIKDFAVILKATYLYLWEFSELSGV